MSTEKKFTFDIDEPTAAFTKHLSLEGNDRIILSAPFGAGKTYFLKEFFEENTDKYEFIHLYPVNYSVASNEDIFELVKYDILIELMDKTVEFDQIQFSKIEFLPLFIKNNKGKILNTLSPLISSIPKVGKLISGMMDKIKGLVTEFEKQFDGVNTDDKQTTNNFLEEFIQQKGSIYEEDFYTQLICQLVDQLKNKDNEGNATKETVLIIDDLDRIDPEHIFRILNVLAAQMDKNTADNKFDFDKIILVFDQHNVRNIFRNRYGMDVDFTGYIDKFYSYKIFEFTNIEGQQKDITEILKSIISNNLYVDFDKKDDTFAQGIVYVFKRLVQANVLTVRRLLKVWNQKMTFSYNLNSFNTVIEIHYIHFYILNLAELLLFIYEDWDDVLYSIKKITELDFNEDPTNRDYVRSIINESLLLLDAENHGFKEGKESYTFINKEYNINFSYSLKSSIRLYYCDLEVKDRSNLDNPSLLSILFLALNEVKERNMLN